MKTEYWAVAVVFTFAFIVGSFPIDLKGDAQSTGAIQHCFSDDTTPDECVTMVAIAEKSIGYCNFLDDDSSSYCYQIFFEQSSL